MIRILVAIALVSFSTSPLFAQKEKEKVKVDSIAFHLYTDSLKKGGVYNYINVDGKMSNGRWQPLSAEDISFTTSGGKFDGCNLYFDSTFNADSVVVKAILKADTSLRESITIYIKKLPDDEVLKSMEEVMQPSGRQPARKRKRG
ncbi:hypothetical protein [Pseudobacter ginsenosidimutans]|jgi:hypothetical protein|uniref:hypothetical protein n=1 Tax=Pseudobacter ginsenosidimutans TaxID=661488 RepID=UPI00102DD4B7|nr:hypothetical protein [Pseudobacter ginsenosidimutans]QEC43015.1 hypothetical protein FSB84_15435 [Pseudobacter ginsenosidimutans]